MPSEPTAEQADIRRKGRQRLVGAVVLALLAVVFVPMALDPEPRRDRPEPALAIPPKNAPAVAAAPVAAEPAKPVTEPAAEPAKPGPEPAPDPEAKPAEPVKPAPATPAVKAIEPKAPPKPAPKATPPAKPEPANTPKLEGFAVQVGAFREEAKLQQARDKLKSARVPHYTERIDAEGGALTRLRAGPYPTREDAEKAAAAIRKAGIDGRVVPLP